MKVRHQNLLFTSLGVVLAIWFIFALCCFLWPRSIAGAWTNTRPYQEGSPGSIGLVIQKDGNVEVIDGRGSKLWWAQGKHELYLCGEIIEIRSGNRVVGELLVKQRRGELSLLDRAYPGETIQMQRMAPKP